MGRARWLPSGLWLGASTFAATAFGQTAVPTPSELEPAPKSAGADEAAPVSDPANVFVPIVMYTPETHVGFGGFFVHFFRPPPEVKERVSSLAFVAIATTRRQAILEAHPDFYFLSEKLHLFGKVEYQYYPDTFWGVGP